MFFYSCTITAKPDDDGSGYKVGNNYVSLNKFKVSGSFSIWSCIPNPYNPFYFYDSVVNKSIEFQIEFIKSLKYEKEYNHYFFVKEFIKSTKVKELYYKLKTAHNIIK